MSVKAAGPTWPSAAVHILSYLERHPGAVDTVEGIAEWWITRERIEQGVRETVAALEFLVSRDLVIEDRASENRPRYRLNPSRLDELRALMSDRQR